MERQTEKEWQDFLVELGPALKKNPLGVGAADPLGDEVAGFLQNLWAVMPQVSWDAELFLPYAAKIIQGTDQRASTYWGALERFDERAQAVAPLVVALLETQTIFWDDLTVPVQKQIFAWVNQVNQLNDLSDSALMMRILVNVVGKKLGQPIDEKNLADDVKACNQLYQRDGWYAPTLLSQPEEKMPTAFHVYGLLVAHYVGDEDGALAQVLRARATAFAKTYRYFFDDNGATLHLGDDFSAGTFWSMCVFTQTAVLPWPEIKFILLNYLNYQASVYEKNKANVEKIAAFTETAQLAATDFIFLAVTDAQVFWHVVAEKAIKAEKILVEVPKLLVTNVQGENVQLFPARREAQGHTFNPLVFAARFKKITPELAPSQLFANCFAVAKAGSEHFVTKEKTLKAETNQIFNKQWWSPFPGTTVITTVVPFGDWHVRFHQIDTQTPVTVVDGGFLNELGDNHTTKLGDGRSYTSALGTTASLNLYGFAAVQEVGVAPENQPTLPHSLYFTLAQTLGVADNHLLISGHYAGLKKATTLPKINFTETFIELVYRDKKMIFLW